MSILYRICCQIVHEANSSRKIVADLSHHTFNLNGKYGLGSLARIVEIACIDRDSNVLVDSLVNPGVAIPAEAAAIHGITDADVSDKLCFTDLWPLVWDVVRLADCVLIYNAAFDSRLIRQSLQGDEGALNQAAQLRCGCIMELYTHISHMAEYPSE